MQRDLEDIVEELNDAKSHFNEMENEVAHAEMNRDDAKSNLEDLRRELKEADFQVLKKWDKDNN